MLICERWSIVYEKSLRKGTYHQSGPRMNLHKHRARPGGSNECDDRLLASAELDIIIVPSDDRCLTVDQIR